jgi:O-antigen ligase
VLITYYAFLFSMPFLIFELGFSGSSIPKTLGFLFIMTTFLKPRICYGRLNIAIWFFASYLLMYLLISIRTILILPEPDRSNLLIAVLAGFQTLVQLIVLFWVSSNLLTDNRVARASLFAFASGCILLGVIQSLGYTGDVESPEGRVAAFGTNPNLVGGFLVLGLVILVGLSYGQANMNRKARTCFWFFSALLVLAIIRTGSRGNVLALLAGCAVFVLHRASLSQRIKLWTIVVVGVVLLVIASFTDETMRTRWERTLFAGDTAGRDEINAEAEDMIAEKPFFGWGPVSHQLELGRRVGYPGVRDFHNLYFHLLAEVGLLGSIPFFLGVFVCFRSAWRARNTSQGILPLAILTSVLAMNIGGTSIASRELWLIFAYTAASGTYPIVRRKTLSFETIKLRRAHPGTSQPVLSSPSRYPRRSV